MWLLRPTNAYSLILLSFVQNILTMHASIPSILVPDISPIAREPPSTLSQAIFRTSHFPKLFIKAFILMNLEYNKILVSCFHSINALWKVNILFLLLHRFSCPLKFGQFPPLCPCLLWSEIKWLIFLFLIEFS